MFTPEETRIKKPNGATARRMRFLSILAITIIPLHTLLFAAKGGLLTSNLSKTGNMPGNYWGFVFWGITCAIAFRAFLAFLSPYLNCQRKYVPGFFRAACALLASCTIIPFMPDVYPFFSFLHSCTGYIALLLTLASTFLLCIEVRQIDADISKKALRLWGLHFAICLLSALLTQISGLTEALFISTSSMLMFHLMRWVYQSDALSGYRAGQQTAFMQEA